MKKLRIRRCTKKIDGIGNITTYKKEAILREEKNKWILLYYPLSAMW